MVRTIAMPLALVAIAMVTLCCGEDQTVKQKVAPLPPAEAIKQFQAHPAKTTTAFTVIFEVESAFIPLGGQRPGTELPIGLVPAFDERKSKVNFSVLLMDDVARVIKRLGIFRPEKYFAGRTVQVTGVITESPPADPKTSGPSYQISVVSVDNFQVVH